MLCYDGEALCLDWWLCHSPIHPSIRLAGIPFVFVYFMYTHYQRLFINFRVCVPVNVGACIVSRIISPSQTWKQFRSRLCDKKKTPKITHEVNEDTSLSGVKLTNFPCCRCCYCYCYKWFVSAMCPSSVSHSACFQVWVSVSNTHIFRVSVYISPQKCI